MKMKLNEKFPDEIIVNGFIYRLSLSFDRVLSYIELVRSEEYTSAEVIDICYSWFVVSPAKASDKTKAEVIERIRKEIIFPPSRTLKTRKKTPVSFDFSFDAAEIYASFYKDYGIDLDKERGKMHWCAFIALFNGLSENTPIKRIMDIRTKEIPAFTGKNHEKIARLTELKTIYALPTAITNHDKNGSSDWGALFDMLEEKAR